MATANTTALALREPWDDTNNLMTGTSIPFLMANDLAKFAAISVAERPVSRLNHINESEKGQGVDQLHGLPSAGCSSQKTPKLETERTVDQLGGAHLWWFRLAKQPNWNVEEPLTNSMDPPHFR